MDSLRQLKKNNEAIERLTEKLSLIEKETSSIASELDAIETKISPMLSQHVPSYHSSLSCGVKHADDTTATCTCTLSKANTPDRNGASPQHGDETGRPDRQYINLSNFDCECLLGEMDNVSGLFCSDLSSISKCQSFERMSVNNCKDDEVEVFIGQDGWCSADGSNVKEWLRNRDDDDSYIISLPRDERSVVSCLSDIANGEEDCNEPGNFKIDSVDHAVSDTVVVISGDGSTEIRSLNSTGTHAKTGRKSHLYSFPEDMCCLLNEPSLDLTIPAASADGQDDAPCFPFGIKNRNQEQDECDACVIC